MAEDEHLQPAILNINNSIMKNHMITFLIQYIAATQSITDKRQLVEEIMYAWEKKFAQSMARIKKAAAHTYAERLDDDEDVWNILTDVSNMHIDGLSKDFSEKMKLMLLENLNLSGTRDC